MTAAIVIPARFGSSRLPGKPMRVIAGVSMLERMWRIARAADGCDRVVIATEDRRVLDHAQAFGAEVVMTSEHCINGTERTLEAVSTAGITQDAIINLQGDAVLTPPWILSAMIKEFSSGNPFDIVTPAVALSGAQLADLEQHKIHHPSSGTTVVFDRHRNALYFSKSIIPYRRSTEHVPVYRHIGLYGYTRAGLERYMAAPPSPLELTEGLEQLRALENDQRVRVVVVDYRGRTHASVDTLEDISRAEEIISREGELV